MQQLVQRFRDGAKREDVVGLGEKLPAALRELQRVLDVRLQPDRGGHEVGEGNLHEAVLVLKRRAGIAEHVVPPGAVGTTEQIVVRHGLDQNSMPVLVPFEIERVRLANAVVGSQLDEKAVGIVEELQQFSIELVEPVVFRLGIDEMLQGTPNHARPQHPRVRAKRALQLRLFAVSSYHPGRLARPVICADQADGDMTLPKNFLARLKKFMALRWNVFRTISR